MSAWTRALTAVKAALARRAAAPRMAGLFAAPPAAPAAGWWRDDHVEQLRHYTSWVYTAVNAIAQEVARQRPALDRVTGPADHDRAPLPPAHPLARLVANPNPWLTAWELQHLAAGRERAALQPPVPLDGDEELALVVGVVGADGSLFQPGDRALRAGEPSASPIRDPKSAIRNLPFAK